MARRISVRIPSQVFSKDSVLEGVMGLRGEGPVGVVLINLYANSRKVVGCPRGRGGGVRMRMTVIPEIRKFSISSTTLYI